MTYVFIFMDDVETQLADNIRKYVAHKQKIFCVNVALCESVS